MEHGPSVISLSIVVLCALITPLILSRLNVTFLPTIIAEILVGILIGTSFLNIVNPEESILQIISTLGFVFLMFLSGMEIDFNSFKKNEKKKKNKFQKRQLPNMLGITTLIFVLIMIISIIFAYVMKWLGLFNDVLFLVIVISTISLGVVVPTLKETQLISRPIGQVILLVACIADLVTIILLAVYAQLNVNSDSSLWLMLLLVVFGFVFYIIGRYSKRTDKNHSLNKPTLQIGIRAILAMMLILVSLAETVGAENILGAFIAGCIVSLLDVDDDVKHKLDSFGYGFFIPVFFIMIGVELDVIELFQDKRTFILIPVLLVAYFLSKIIPTMVLLRYYNFNRTIASGFLLTSTLSLVIAAAVVAQNIGSITNAESGIFILSAVFACILAPILFKQFYPKEEIENRQTRLAIFGNNLLTHPVATSLAGEFYEIDVIYREDFSGNRESENKNLRYHKVDDYSLENLREMKIEDKDIVVVAANKEETNRHIIDILDEFHFDRVIVKTDNVDDVKRYHEENDYEVFSPILSQKTILRGLIESPNMIKLLSDEQTPIYEVVMKNHKYERTLLRDFPFNGDVIFMRILRRNDSIIPHGDTELNMYDKIFVTGSRKYIQELKQELEFDGRLN